MYTLGINAYHADSSAAIFHNGIMLAAIEEERITRIKHWAGFPAAAIKFCLLEAGISINDVDAIAIGRDTSAKYISKIKYVLTNPKLLLGAVQSRIGNKHAVLNIAEAFKIHFPEADLEILNTKIKYVEHHRSHLASAFYASPYNEAALLSIDGSGDFTTTMLGIGRGTDIEVIASVDYPCSLGLFYTSITQYLGFPHYGDEYKVMGLAPYGNAIYVDKLREIIFPDLKTGLIAWNPKFFNLAQTEIVNYKDNIPFVNTLFTDEVEKIFGKARIKDAELSQHHKDIAASVQRYTEELIFHLLNTLYEKTGLKNVCIAGGVAQNSVANGKILQNTPFENLYIPSAGHDAGISMGAGMYHYHNNMGMPRVPAVMSAYTGSQFSNAEIEEFLKSRNMDYTRYTEEELYEVVANKLIEPGVVGWFSGRAEFGPRALGGRSIIADPRNNKAKELLNLKIKRRESFRPFAPSILKEYAHEYFENACEVPFMERVLPIRTEKRAEIPAVTHADGSGRLQTVDKQTSPRYYALIDKFREKTGVPILLNTSFNENEPIVNTPEEALNCYLRTSMDMLVLENCVISR